MIEAVVGLGANLGDRVRTMRRAVWSLGLPVLAVSSLYESAPVETAIAQPDYLNAVAVYGAPDGQAPQDLLRRLLDVEASLGRVRGPGKPPRTLDLDLLLFGRLALREAGLEVPHPGLLRRRFVLEPLLEVRPLCLLPDGSGVAPHLGDVAGQAVRRVTGGSWWWRIGD